MQGLQERPVCVHFHNRLEQARGAWLLPLHTCRISLKLHVLLADLNVSFITLAFQGSQSFGCAVIKPCKWLKSSKGAIRCILVLVISAGTRLQKGWFGFSRPAMLMVLPLWAPCEVRSELPHLTMSLCCILLHNKSRGEEKKHLAHSLFMPSQWRSVARSCQRHCNTAPVTANQRNNLIMVKLLLELVWGRPGPGKGCRTGLPAAAGSPLEGTAVVQEGDWSAGLRARATIWFIVMRCNR